MACLLVVLWITLTKIYRKSTVHSIHTHIFRTHYIVNTWWCEDDIVNSWILRGILPMISTSDYAMSPSKNFDKLTHLWQKRNKNFTGKPCIISYTICYSQASPNWPHNKSLWTRQWQSGTRHAYQNKGPENPSLRVISVILDSLPV